MFIFVLILTNLALAQQIQHKKVFMYHSDTLVYRLIRSLEKEFDIKREAILEDKKIYFARMNGIDLGCNFSNPNLLTFMAVLPSHLSYKQLNQYNRDYLFKFQKETDGGNNANIQIHFEDGITLEHLITEVTYFLNSIKEISQDF